MTFRVSRVTSLANTLAATGGEARNARAGPSPKNHNPIDVAPASGTPAAPCTLTFTQNASPRRLLAAPQAASGCSRSKLMLIERWGNAGVVKPNRLAASCSAFNGLDIGRPAFCCSTRSISASASSAWHGRERLSPARPARVRGYPPKRRSSKKFLSCCWIARRSL
jgi:hypothetical protein